MPITGVRVTGGTMTMLDAELFATQLLVPELTLEPSAMFERVAGLVMGEGVTLGAVTRGVESLVVGAAGVETGGIRTMPVLD
jgi:hypothetical protein